jgi:hypothetical protein
MQIIQRSLDGVALPDIKYCEHLGALSEQTTICLGNYKQCANCAGYMCADCEDYAVICHACPASICKECQETARKRQSGTYGEACRLYDYLCNPCRDKQDEATIELLRVGMKWGEAIEALSELGREPWLDELLDASSRLESAIEKAKEAL